MPVILGWNICSIFVQPLFHISCISTFSLITPPLTLHDRLRVLPPSVIWKDPQESGGASVWPLKYWTTASPVLLLTVVTWNVRPCFSLTYLLLESKLSERRVWPILLLVKFLIPQYDDSAVQCGGEVELETKFATSSQPPGMKRA